uniref:(2E,6E)-farnesyl diphosphate synthase n=1 Tax=Thaumasiovibrio occultus TaxID=1891184 RepID=UPI000B34AF74|nr:(2E,6E)-farnesyl diphosphate synthase [Thaumasiovibrio occultus]
MTVTEPLTLKDTLQQYQQRNNDHLMTWLARLPHQDNRLIEAMRHGTLLGGKRARPFLVYSVGKMLGVDLAHLDAPAAAIECIHAFSLIHDDLPAMDDDDLRRGQPTCHKAFDEATAILAGDALQALAFEILSRGEMHTDAQRVEMMALLATATRDMCIGQALDLQAEDQLVPLDQLETIHRNKTGALMRAAVLLGAYAAGERAQTVLSHLDTYANAIGLAFQVQDDILDITGDTATLGKPQGSDLEANKSTYPALMGLEAAQQKAQQLYQLALHALQQIPYNTEELEVFARYVIERNN